MATRAVLNQRVSLQPNVGGFERWASLLGGLGLFAAAARRGPAPRRAMLGAAGISLLARGATRYCPLKAKLTGQSTLSGGLSEQMRRAKSSWRGGAALIESSMDLYLAELQEARDSELIMAGLLTELQQTVGGTALRNALANYASGLKVNQPQIEKILRSHGAKPGAHPDDSMRRLATEARKMMNTGGGPAVRDSALVGSLQRLIHYRIAAYGTLAAYAKQLGEIYEAGALASIAEQEKAMDARLSELAEATVNPEAAAPRKDQDQTRPVVEVGDAASAPSSTGGAATTLQPGGMEPGGGPGASAGGVGTGSGSTGGSPTGDTAHGGR